MNSNVRKIVSAVAVAATMGAGSASAAIVVDDWTLNLSGIDGLVNPTVITGIDQIQFTGVAHSEQVTDAPGGGGLGQIDVGDISRTRGLLSATSFQGNGGVILGTGLNNDYEMTFKFDVGGQTTIVNGTNSEFTHILGGGATGLLEIWIGAAAAGNLNSNQVTGNGYMDGQQIATFAVLPGNGGVFSALNLNGSDDATFALQSAMAGVFFDKNGADLSTLLGSTLLVTASQFDADQNNDGSIDVNCPTNGLIGGGAAAASTFTNFCAQEDGRASLMTVAEPGTLAALGLGIGVLGLFGRRKTNASA